MCIGTSPSVRTASLFGSGLMKYTVGNPRTCKTFHLCYPLSNLQSMETLVNKMFMEATLMAMGVTIQRMWLFKMITINQQIQAHFLATEIRSLKSDFLNKHRTRSELETNVPKSIKINGSDHQLIHILPNKLGFQEPRNRNRYRG